MYFCIGNNIDILKTAGNIEYMVILGFSSSSNKTFDCTLTLYSETMQPYVVQSCVASIVISNPTLWWNAFSENGPPAFLYSLNVTLRNIVYKHIIVIRNK